jgi:Zn-dependent protease with chaperone function
MQPMQTASIQAMKAIGRSDYYLKLEIIKKVANFIILIISLFMFNSVFAVAIGALLAELSSTLINVPANKALFGYSYKLQLFDVLPEISAALLMAVVVIIVGLLPLSKFILLIIQVLAGGLIYYAIAKVFKMKSLNYLESTINEVLHRRKS